MFRFRSTLITSRRIAALALLALLGTVATAHANVTNATALLQHYDLITLGDLVKTAEVEGRTYVGGSITATNAANFAIHMGSAPTTDETLLVVGNVVAGGPLSVNAGSMRYGGSLNGRIINMNGGGTKISDPSMSAAQVIADLKAASLTLGAATANNTATLPSSQPGPAKLDVTATNSCGVAIFQVSAASLFGNGNVQQIELNPGSAQTVLINVTGNVTWNAGNMVGNLVQSSVRAKVLWNFVDATSINFGSHNMMGAVLAPLAAVTTSNNVDGSTAVASLDSGSEIHQPEFTGNLSCLAGTTTSTIPVTTTSTSSSSTTSTLPSTTSTSTSSSTSSTSTSTIPSTTSTSTSSSTSSTSTSTIPSTTSTSTSSSTSSTSTSTLPSTTSTSTSSSTSSTSTSTLPSTTSTSTSSSSTSTSISTSTSSSTSTSTSVTSTTSITATTLQAGCACSAGTAAFRVAKTSKINNDATVHGGISVNNPHGMIKTGKNVVTTDGSLLVADYVQLGNAANVFGVETNNLRLGQSVTVRNGSGLLPPPAPPLPLQQDFCALPAPIACGTQGIIVFPGEQAGPLPPGTYGSVRVLNGGTLRLAPGQFTFCSVKIGRGSLLLTDDQTVIDIESSLYVGSGAYCGPEDIADPTPNINVAGSGARVSQGGTLRAAVTAPHAKLTFGRDSTLLGCFCASQQKSDKHITLTCTP